MSTITEKLCRSCDTTRTVEQFGRRTGKVRALLSDPCNTALGLLQENPELLRKAALYIEAGRA